MNYKFGVFTGNMLKWIAIITMVIDHMGAILFPQYQILRIIGRLAFPLFAFLLVEGYVHTSNLKKYLGRLLLFALIAEIPFDIAMYSQAFYWGHQNVFWTLFLGLLVLYLIDRLPEKWMGLIAGIAIMVVAHLITTDYGAGGIIVIFALYYFRAKPLIKYIVMAAVFILVFGGIQILGLIVIIPMLLYNGQRGKYSMKYFFYLFYPCHLIVLQLLWMKMNVW